MKINTKQALEIFKLINVIDIKSDLISMVVKSEGLLEQRNKQYAKLYDYLGDKDIEINEDITYELLNNNMDIAKEISDIESQLSILGLNFSFELISKIEKYKRKVCKVLSKSLGIGYFKLLSMNESDISKIIVEVIMSESFKNIFDITPQREVL